MRTRRDVTQRRDQLEADPAVHHEIEDDDLGLERPHLRQAVLDALRLADDLDARVGVEQHADADTYDSEIVDHDCANCAHLPRFSRSLPQRHPCRPRSRLRQGRKARTASPASQTPIAKAAARITHCPAAPAAIAIPTKASVSTAKSRPKRAALRGRCHAPILEVGCRLVLGPPSTAAGQLD